MLVIRAPLPYELHCPTNSNCRHIQLRIYCAVADKPLYWLATSLDDLRRFPEPARRQAGYELRRLQQGLEPTDWKPLSSIGLGVHEIRLHVGTAHRVFYVAKFTEAIYVEHAFEKRTQRMAPTDQTTGQRRYRDLLAWRRTHGEE